jgi:hypothetical protein
VKAVRLKKYGGTPNVVRACCAAQSPGHDRSLKETYSAQFYAWCDSLQPQAGCSFRPADRQRLTELKLVYKLAYGFLIDALADIGKKYERPKRPLRQKLEEVLGSLSHHSTASEENSVFELRAKDLTRPYLRRLLKATSARERNAGQELLGWRSGCRMQNGSILHLPMLDFRIKANPANLEVIAAALATIDLVRSSGGAILNSGDSFHYIGFSLVSQRELMHFLHRTLLLIPLVDARYIGHCLLERECTLRLSGKPRNDPFSGKSPMDPSPWIACILYPIDSRHGQVRRLKRRWRERHQ